MVSEVLSRPPAAGMAAVSNCASLHPLAVQQRWAAAGLKQRLAVLRAFRHRFAGRSAEIADAISPALARSRADTLVAELLPLLAACRFLEREAAHVLRTRTLGRRGRPVWLTGVETEIRREPLGHVLIIAPFNYPLLLPGVQVLQALAAGNAVTWKPGRDGAAAAHVMAETLFAAGLERSLLSVTGESIEDAEAALSSGPAKVFFTGSAQAGHSILHALAKTATPSVMELSGCDAVLVLPGAELAAVMAALTFGMRLNGSSTCMAPRRLILVGADRDRRDRLVRGLVAAFANVPAVSLPAGTRRDLDRMLGSAQREGAAVVGDPAADPLRPLLVLRAAPQTEIAQADLFAPVLTLLEARDAEQAIELQRASPLALTACIFGNTAEALELAPKLKAGTVLINDLIVATADPRVPFGGRGASGFGSTRGAEGLLEMTTPKVVAVRQRVKTRQFEPTTPEHEALFRGWIESTHAGSWRRRWSGLRTLAAAARRLPRGNATHSRSSSTADRSNR